MKITVEPKKKLYCLSIKQVSQVLARYYELLNLGEKDLSIHVESHLETVDDYFFEPDGTFDVSITAGKYEYYDKTIDLESINDRQNYIDLHFSFDFERG